MTGPTITPAGGRIELVVTLPDEPAEPACFPGGSPSILRKAFDILESLNQDGRRLTLSQISRRCGLAKSTAHRVIKMLIELDAVERDGEHYRIGSRMFSLGCRFSRARLRDVARPFLQTLALRTGHDVQFAVLQDDGVLVLESIGDSHPLHRVSVGDRLDPCHSALGKTLLAYCGEASTAMLQHTENRGTVSTADLAMLAPQLIEVRMSHYGLDVGHTARGLGCVAVPVLAKGRLLGAVSVTSRQVARSSVHSFVGALQETAARIARATEREEATERSSLALVRGTAASNG